MTRDLTFKLVVTEGDKPVYSANLSYEAVSDFVTNFPDKSDSNDFFILAAQHPVSTVREQVAYKDSLNSDTVEILKNDASISVLRHLVRSSAFRETASQDYLEKIIPLDVEIARNIASEIQLFEQADVNKLATFLAGNPDPSVAASLAQNYSTPKKILKALTTHKDPYIAAEAKARLEK